MPSGKWKITKEGKTRAELAKAAWECRRATGKTKPFLSPEVREAKRQRMTELRKLWHSMGKKIPHRPPLTPEERSVLSQRLKQDNPMARPEIRAKVSQRLLEKTEWRQRMSERMKTANPMKDPAAKERMGQSLRQSLAKAGHIERPWLRKKGRSSPSPEAREKAKLRMLTNNPMKNPETVQRVVLIRRWRQFSSPKSYVAKWIRRHIGPNKVEKALETLIAPLGFKFVGDGHFWIGPCLSGKCRNPDFIYKSGKLRIALLYNSRYWHDLLPTNDDAEELADYAALHWRVLVVKEEDMNSAVKDKVLDWLSGLRLSQ